MLNGNQARNHFLLNRGMLLHCTVYLSVVFVNKNVYISFICFMKSKLSMQQIFTPSPINYWNIGDNYPIQHLLFQKKTMPVSTLYVRFLPARACVSLDLIPSLGCAHAQKLQSLGSCWSMSTAFNLVKQLVQNTKMDARWGIGLALLVLSFAASSLAQCLDGWTSAGFHCYKAFDEPRSWKEAESHCQSFSLEDNKAHLTSVSDIPENVLLKTWLDVTEKNVTGEHLSFIESLVAVSIHSNTSICSFKSVSRFINFDREKMLKLVVEQFNLSGVDGGRILKWLNHLFKDWLAISRV